MNLWCSLCLPTSLSLAGLYYLGNRSLGTEQHWCRDCQSGRSQSCSSFNHVGFPLSNSWWLSSYRKWVGSSGSDYYNILPHVFSFVPNFSSKATAWVAFPMLNLVKNIDFYFSFSRACDRSWNLSSLYSSPLQCASLLFQALINLFILSTPLAFARGRTLCCCPHFMDVVFYRITEWLAA